MEDYLKARARSSFNQIRRLKMKAANQRARLDPLLEIAGGMAVAAVLVFIGWRIVKGQTTIGDFTGFVTALLLAAQSMRTLGNLNAVLQEASSALERVFGVLDEPREVGEKPGAQALLVTSGEISFRNVSLRYGEDAEALQGLDITVPGGRMTALVGRSGSGKSSLMSLVPRLYDPSEGAVSIDGADLRDIALRSLREQIAIVTQEPIIFDDTVRANIALGKPDASQAEIEAAARSAAAHDFIAALPEGYETRLGDRGSRLSGGERQTHCACPSDHQERPDPATRRGNQRAGLGVRSGWCRTRWPA